MVKIPNFEPQKATKYIKTQNSPYVTLLYLRDIENRSITNAEFLTHQNQLLAEPDVVALFAKQLDTGGWLPRKDDQVYNPMYRSTIWQLIYLGYLGLNGTTIPQIIKAIDYSFRNFYDQEEGIFPSISRYSGFLQCLNGMFLRALLKMGFSRKKRS